MESFTNVPFYTSNVKYQFITHSQFIAHNHPKANENARKAQRRDFIDWLAKHSSFIMLLPLLELARTAPACSTLILLQCIVGAAHDRLRQNKLWSTFIDDFSGDALRRGHVWLTVSSSFLHANWMHVVYNALRLILSGVAVERAVGSQTFIVVYLFSGNVACIISWLMLRRQFQKSPPFEGQSADEGALYADLTPTRGASANTYGILACAVTVAGSTRATTAYGMQSGSVVWRMIVIARVLPELLRPSNARFAQKPVTWGATLALFAFSAAAGPQDPCVADGVTLWFSWVCVLRAFPGLLCDPAAPLGASDAHAMPDVESHLAGALVAGTIGWWLRAPTLHITEPGRCLALPLVLIVLTNFNPKWLSSLPVKTWPMSPLPQPADDEDEVWFGSRPARLVVASGVIEPYSRGKYVEDASHHSLRITRMRAVPIPPPDANQVPLVVPAIPCVELRLSSDSHFDETVVPVPLRTPLVKTSLDTPGVATAGIASGIRSALVSVDGKWYRLKGCGNGDGGFAIRTTDAKSGAWRDVRGSAFVHTGRRELHVSDQLGRVPEAVGCVSANVPVALWRYNGAFSPFGQSELLQTACAVEETRGDRRLGTHVLSGINIILPLLVGHSSSLDDLRHLFPAARPDGIEVSTAALMTDTMLAFELSASAGEVVMHGITWPDVVRKPELFASAIRAGVVLCECAPTDDSSLPMQWTQEGPQPMGSRWVPRWRSACRDLAAVIDELCAQGRGDETVLGYLFARIGHECGTILREMHLAGYSWGTYTDAMCFEGQWHCNAHSNNCIVLSEEQAARAAPGTREPPFCACLDFDMAFTAASFVDLQKPNGSEASDVDGAAGCIGVDSANFAMLLARERLNFAEVLAGGDCTSGVPKVAMTTVEAQPDGVQGARHVLHDTLVCCFMRAYDEAAVHSAVYDPLLHRGAYAVLRMAIIIMADCLA